MSLIMIIVTTALVNNVVLSQFLGICSFLGVSSQKKASLSLGLAVTAVLTVSSAVASLLYDYVLLPLGLDYLKTIVFILVIAALVQMVEMFLKSRISKPEIILKPATSIISMSMTSTLKSITSSQLKMCEKLWAADFAPIISSSSFACVSAM